MCAAGLPLYLVRRTHRGRPSTRQTLNPMKFALGRPLTGMVASVPRSPPGPNVAGARPEPVGYVTRSRAFTPPGTVPPFIMRFDSGSVPVGYLVLSSETLSVEEIQDQALFKVRPMFASIPGVSAPPPFGGSQRTVVIRADPHRMR